MSNLVTHIAFAAAARQAQVSADWAGGMNAGGCNPGVGINTGDYSPKDTDWPEVEITAAASQFIGGVDVTETTGADTGLGGAATFDLLDADDGEFAFVQADAETDADDPLDSVTGAVNRTGKTVPAAAWCWGTIPGA